MNHQNLPTDMNLGYVVELNTVEIHTDETTSVVENDLTVKLKFKYVIKKFVNVKVRLQSFNEYWIKKKFHLLICITS